MSSKNIPIIVGVSGKIASGKDYFASHLASELEKRGYKVYSTSMANALRTEADNILDRLRELDVDGHSANALIKMLSDKFNIPREKASELYKRVEPIISEGNIDSHSRSPHIRSMLQYLGTDVRRKAEPDYWVDRMLATIRSQTGTDFVTIPDIRFPNEANMVIKNGGYLYRMDTPENILAERRMSRDHITYTKEALNHPSETSLDDYKDFSEYVPTDFDVETIAQRLILSTVRL